MREDYYHWPFDQLVGYISKEHLRMNQILSGLGDDFRELAAKNLEPSPRLREIQRRFACLADDVQRHLSKEAVAVFPFLWRYAKELRKSRKHRNPGLHSACFPVDKMYKEHKKEKEYLNLLLQLMDAETFSEKQDPIYATISTKMSELNKLWEELVSLENNIVFPRLIEMEAALTLN